jgi:hypothetical protein
MHRHSHRQYGRVRVLPLARRTRTLRRSRNPCLRRDEGRLTAFVFAVFTLYGCGAKAVLYGTTILVLGIPIYVWRPR